MGFRVPTAMFSSALLHFPSGISDVQANKVASWSQIKEAEVLVEWFWWMLFYSHEMTLIPQL